MVVFEDGVARKSEYRRFTVRGDDGQDDVAAIHEVITRRFRRYLAEREDTADLDLAGRRGGPGRRTFSSVEAGLPGEPRLRDVLPGSRRLRDVSAGSLDPRPAGRAGSPTRRNLVVVDGGAAAGRRRGAAMAELGVDDVALCGLAKRLEEVWLPGERRTR